MERRGGRRLTDLIGLYSPGLVPAVPDKSVAENARRVSGEK